MWCFIHVFSDHPHLPHENFAKLGFIPHFHVSKTLIFGGSSMVLRPILSPQPHPSRGSRQIHHHKIKFGLNSRKHRPIYPPVSKISMAFPGKWSRNAGCSLCWFAGGYRHFRCFPQHVRPEARLKPPWAYFEGRQPKCTWPLRLRKKSQKSLAAIPKAQLKFAQTRKTSQKNNQNSSTITKIH